MYGNVPLVERRPSRPGLTAAPFLFSAAELPHARLATGRGGRALCPGGDGLRKIENWEDRGNYILRKYKLRGRPRNPCNCHTRSDCNAPKGGAFKVPPAVWAERRTSEEKILPECGPRPAPINNHHRPVPHGRHHHDHRGH